VLFAGTKMSVGIPKRKEKKKTLSLVNPVGKLSGVHNSLYAGPLYLQKV